VDFRTDELNGTIHLMLLFLARDHNIIANIRYVYVDDHGIQKENQNREIRKNDGVEILFLDTNMIPHTVTYYSVNLDNANYGSNAGMQKYIERLGTFNTYLKAASYLMHRINFSIIRSTILARTKYLLEDDSGIPYRFFQNKDQWKANFYGVYVRPIPLFSNYYQPDLDSAYKDSTNYRKSLNFGIGYNFKQSNLMLFEKK